MRARLVAALLVTALGLAACEDEPVATAPPPRRPVLAGGAGAGATNADAGPAGPPPMAISDQTFVESQLVRDPFRSFAYEFVNTGATRVVDTRDVKLGQFSLDDLRLVAVIVGTDSPYAMVIDPSRAGTILRRGMYVGRQEIIHGVADGAQDYAVHWRVARINPARLRRGADSTLEEVPAEIVFERPDPLNPNAQVVERSLALAPPQNAPGGQSAPGGLPLPPALSALPPGQATSGTAFLPPNLNRGVGATEVQTVPMPGGGATTTTTTVVVQPPAAAPAPPPPNLNAPPPVTVTGGGAALPSSGLAQ